MAKNKGKEKEKTGVKAEDQPKEEKQSLQEDAKQPSNEERKDSGKAAVKPTSASGHKEDAKQPSKVQAASSHILMFGRWDTSGVRVEDKGLSGYINLDPVIVPRTGGRYATEPFHKNDMNIVERLVNKLMVPGHRGKRHKITSGRCTASTQAIYRSVKNAFEIIEKKTRQNPVQVLVKAVENSALLEEIASYRLGGIIARQSVTVAPQRRLDIALKHLAQGIYKNSFKSKKSLAEVIAEELIAASKNDAKSFAVSERNRIEREAEGAR